MRFINKLFVICILVQSCFISVVSAFDFSLLGTFSVSSYNYNPDPGLDLSKGVGFGAGATIGFDWVPFFSWETGVLYMSHSMTVSTNNFDITYRYVDIPLWLRFSPIDLISINVGGYYGIAANTTVNNGNAPRTLIGKDASGNIQKNNDFGLLGGVSLRFPLAPLIKLRLDALYQLGLVNISTGTSSQNSRNLNFLAGFMFDLI